MIDWLNLALPAKELEHAAAVALKDARHSLTRAGVGSGEILWRGTAWNTIASPTTRVPVVEWRLTDDRLCIKGCPPKLQGGNNLFGTRDAREAAANMIGRVAHSLGVVLPDPRIWSCTKLDVTLNYVFASGEEVEKALREVALAHIGRRGVRMEGSTIYLNCGGETRFGKMYAKGPHLQLLVREGAAVVSRDDLRLAMTVLRLELTLAHKYWRRADRHWSLWTPEELEDENKQYFAQYIGGMEVMEDRLIEALHSVAPTPGTAKAAYRTWLFIQAHGYQRGVDEMSRSTLRAHKALLRKAGLSDADILAATVIPLRRRTLEMRGPVHSLEELRLAA